MIGGGGSRGVQKGVLFWGGGGGGGVVQVNMDIFLLPNKKGCVCVGKGVWAVFWNIWPFDPDIFQPGGVLGPPPDSYIMRRIWVRDWVLTERTEGT